MNITLATSAQMCGTDTNSFIGMLTQWLVNIMDTVGGVGVAIAIAAESIFPPIPSEIILPLAGFSAARGTLHVVSAVLWATVGSLVGALCLYAIARLIGLERLVKLPGLNKEDIEKANKWFEKYGGWSVCIARVIPVVRSLISIPAGFNRMNLLHFSCWTIAGSLVWNTILIGVGYALGDQWCSILSVLDAVEKIVIALVVLIFIAYVVYRIRKNCARKGEK
ncbi:MAG: DedA family protein [Bifidobacteriaceae bacterium]|nr:DedA family protein [Bifidobacteriaceae bacterium]